MQAMDVEKEPPIWLPNGLLITSETTRLDLESRTAGAGVPRSELILHLAVMECHTWLGIGGRTGRVRRPRRLCRVIPLALPLHKNPSSSGDGDGGSGPDYLRSRDDCRRLIGRAMRHRLRDEEEYRWLSEAKWDEAVPRDVERCIVECILALEGYGGGGTTTYEVRVDISVHFEFAYSEPKALLQACIGDDDGEPIWRTGSDGDAPSCSICFEEMSRETEAATGLLGCTHGFHRRCIGRWFMKASTCPVCRRDKFQYLPPEYRDLHHMMCSGAEH